MRKEPVKGGQNRGDVILLLLVTVRRHAAAFSGPVAPIKSPLQ